MRLLCYYAWFSKCITKFSNYAMLQLANNYEWSNLRLGLKCCSLQTTMNDYYEWSYLRMQVWNDINSWLYSKVSYRLGGWITYGSFWSCQELMLTFDEQWATLVEWIMALDGTHLALRLGKEQLREESLLCVKISSSAVFKLAHQ